MNFPKMIRIKQEFPRPLVGDTAMAIKMELKQIDVAGKTRPDQSVAITVGSRGISNIAKIIKAVVNELAALKLKPFVVPAMGSHGGATAQGQLDVLAHLGITEEFMGCPIVSSMEVEKVACSQDGVISYVDKHALMADHIVVVNRVKKHTEFEGKIESGLCKMLCIGLGKHQGAAHYHRIGVNVGLENAIVTGAKGVLHNANVLCGLGIVENAYDETALIKAFSAENIEIGDEELLRISKEWSAKLPFPEADILIIDEIGKDISGSGYDTKVVGRLRSTYCISEPQWPKIRRIVALDLTDYSEGNAIGVGALDFVSKRLIDKIDRKYTYINGITAQCPAKAAIPMYYDTDRELLEQALETIGDVNPEAARIIRIKNTLHLSVVEVSEAYLPLIQENKELTILSSGKEIAFDKDGNLLSDHLPV